MAQRSLEIAGHPNIEGSYRHGFRKLSFIPNDTDFDSKSVEGQIRYDLSEHKFKYWNGSAEIAFGAANIATTGLDGNYDINYLITVDGNPVTLAGNNNDVLYITQSANDDCLYINKTGTGGGYPIKIANAGTGADIYGTSGTWSISSAGAVVCTSITGTDLTMATSTLSITTDETTGTAFTLNVDSLTSGIGLLIDMNAASTAVLLDILVGATHVLKVSDTGVLTLAGVAEGTSTLTLTKGDLTLTDGDLVLTSGQFTMTPDANADGFTLTGATTGNYDVMYLNGTTNAGVGHILSIAQGNGARTGNAIDVAMGATAVGSVGTKIYSSGGTRTSPLAQILDAGTGADAVGLLVNTAIAYAGSLIELDVSTGNATGKGLFIDNNTGTSFQAIVIDDELSTADIISVDTAANLAANKAQLKLVASAGTPNAAANAILVDWSAATNTSKPVLVKIYDNGVAVGLSVSTASIEDMVTLIGTGATGNDRAVLDVTSTATLNAGGNLVRIDGSGATTTSKPVLLEVLDNSVSTAASFTSSPTGNHVVLVAAGGAMTDGYAGLMVTSGGNLATGGAASAIVIDGSPTSGSIAFEIDAQKNMEAVYIDSDAATQSAVTITGNGVIADNKAMLHVLNTAAIAAGSSLVRIESSAASAGATAYGLEIACDGTNLEGLWVSVGTSKFTEAVTMSSTLGVTGLTTFTAGHQSSAVAVTANDAGTTTAIIPNGTSVVSVNWDGDAAHIVTLPAPTPGTELWLISGATGGEVQSSTPATVAINGGATAGFKSSIAASISVHFFCSSATTWIANTYAADGTEAKLEAAH